ncbi:unnamed protein product [Microthlaspi erraticum]|uniref:Arabidopsis retrotransposon Orf1 C-terminal domain-containing protein n=1 Tax=Microthlaspi erraticum TaxID=1685480 RepID=A0A6D2JHC6_9BRAS|nr:unnamed protein product [Microthlaspi erraticum]
MPLELEYRARLAIKYLNMELSTTQEKREMDIHEPEEIRLGTYESSRIYKERTKAFYEKRIIPKVFKEGDDVLLFNSRLKLFPGKLKSRWSGPFKVKEVLPYGAITLVNQNGIEFTVNGQQVKKYMASQCSGEGSSIQAHYVLRLFILTTRSGKQAPREDEITKRRREKKEGKKKVSETSGKRKRSKNRAESERVPCLVEQDLNDTPIPRPYGVQGRIKILRRMRFLPMRYPHKQPMKELGIDEDVESIFEGMELAKFMKLRLPAYQNLTLHFLASLKIVRHPELAEEEIRRDGAGLITYELLAELIGLWQTISSTNYIIFQLKGGNIRNPTIRYAHKAVAHTLFARYECANVTKVELEMLDISILDHLETLENGEKMEGDRSTASTAIVMLNSFK